MNVVRATVISAAAVVAATALPALAYRLARAAGPAAVSEVTTADVPVVPSCDADAENAGPTFLPGQVASLPQ